MKKNISEEIALLDKVLPVVVRVHGGNHPELHDVLKVYDRFRAAYEKGHGEEEIAEIRRLTGNYTLPEDACEAYTKVYQALQEIDRGQN